MLGSDQIELTRIIQAGTIISTISEIVCCSMMEPSLLRDAALGRELAVSPKKVTMKPRNAKNDGQG